MALRDLPIRVDEDKVAEFCRARGIRRLRLFGSVLRDDFDPTRSDVDVLAEFHPEAVRNSGWEFFLYGEQLGEIFGYKVDLCANLRPWLRPIVEKQAITISTMKKHHSPRGPMLDMREYAQRVADLTAAHAKEDITEERDWPPLESGTGPRDHRRSGKSSTAGCASSVPADPFGGDHRDAESLIHGYDTIDLLHLWYAATVSVPEGPYPLKDRTFSAATRFRNAYCRLR